MSALLEDNSKYPAVRIVKVDWDTFSKAPIVEELQIPRRATLVMFNEGKEVGRVVAQADQQAIARLFDAAT